MAVPANDAAPLPQSPQETEEQAAASTTLTQMWVNYFGPEIDRRAAAGLLPDNFFVYMAQALFPPKGSPTIVFNEDVKGVALTRAQRTVEKGAPVYLEDLQHIESFDLPDDLLDNGHFTIVRASAGWHAFFNFLSGRAKAKGMLVLAGQFLEAAQFSKAKGHAGPAVDNLFSAAELVSKAELILMRNPAGKSKKHGMVASEINKWARVGNIDAAFAALFNKLGNQRPNARYGDDASRPRAPDDDAVDLVRAMIDRGMERVGKTTDRPKSGEGPAAHSADPR